jgi:hypothetical protein
VGRTATKPPDNIRHRGLGLAAAAVRCVEAEMAAAGCRAHEIEALPAVERFWSVLGFDSHFHRNA